MSTSPPPLLPNNIKEIEPPLKSTRLRMYAACNPTPSNQRWVPIGSPLDPDSDNEVDVTDSVAYKEDIHQNRVLLEENATYDNDGMCVARTRIYSARFDNSDIQKTLCTRQQAEASATANPLLSKKNGVAGYYIGLGPLFSLFK